MAARMKRLTLVRHGQAEWKEATVADFDRPLTRRGLAEAADMARRLRVQEHDPPGLILASPAQRAVQTAEVFARELGLADLAVLPAQPCLASRIETGIEVDEPTLQFIERMEIALAGRFPGRSAIRCRRTRRRGEYAECSDQVAPCDLVGVAHARDPRVADRRAL